MSGRINHRTYPRELQGRPVTRNQLDAIYAIIEVKIGKRQVLQRPLIDLLAEAYMLGMISVVDHVTADPGRPVPPHGSGP